MLLREMSMVSRLKIRQVSPMPIKPPSIMARPSTLRTKRPTMNIEIIEPMPRGVMASPLCKAGYISRRCMKIGSRAVIIMTFAKNMDLPSSAPFFFIIPILASLLNLSIPTSLAL